MAAPYRVIIVDDNKTLARETATSLGQCVDIEVVDVVFSGADAIARAAEILPDVMLIDLEMPVMSGIEAIRQIKSQTPSVMLAAWTNFEDDEHLFQAYAAGIAGYILKSASIEKVAQAIRDLAESVLVYFPPTLSGRILEEFRRLQRSLKPALLRPLSAQETQVLTWIADRKTNGQIAIKMGLTTKTVTNHITNILGKLAANNRIEAVIIARERGLLK